MKFASPGLTLASLILIVGLQTAGLVSAHPQQNEQRQLTADEEKQLVEAEKLNDSVFDLYSQGKYDAAIKPAQCVLLIHERVLGPNHRETATSLWGQNTVRREKAAIFQWVKLPPGKGRSSR